MVEVNHPGWNSRLTKGMIVVAIFIAVLLGISVAQNNSSGPGEGWVQRDGASFVLDGEEFRYAGANTYRMMFSPPLVIDAYMQSMQDNNLTVLRTWAFNDVGYLDGSNTIDQANKGTWLQAFDPELGHPVYNDGENGFEVLDYVIKSAADHDIKLVFPLVNNWLPFGGMDQYVTWAGGEHHDDFLSDPEIKQWYKDYVAHVLNRVNPLTGIAYKDDPTIMAWEIANEMRCANSGELPSSDACGPELILEWATEMSAYVKEIDPNHLVGFGGEGFLCTDIGGPSSLTNCTDSADPVALMALDTIDMNGIHIYPDHWGTDPEWSVEWIKTHAQIANDANKPFFIGEYGWRGDTEIRLPVFDSWLQAFYDNGGDGAHVWIMTPRTEFLTPRDEDGFTVYCPSENCTHISNWSQFVRDGVTDFDPIATGDFDSVASGATSVQSVLDNDKVYSPAEWDLATLDLDPETPGIQTEFTVDERGTFTVDGDTIVFVPVDGFTGSARAEYAITDTMGRVSNGALVGVRVAKPDEVVVDEEAAV